MATASLAVRSIVELIGIGALAYWGSQVSYTGGARLALALAAPLALIAVWATVVAPNAASGLSQPQKDAIGTLLLLVAAAALGVAGQREAAVVFGTVVLLNWGLLVFFGQGASEALRAAGGAR